MWERNCVPANQWESSFSIIGKILGKVFKISLSLVEIPSYTIVVMWLWSPTQWGLEYRRKSRWQSHNNIPVIFVKFAVLSRLGNSTNHDNVN